MRRRTWLSWGFVGLVATASSGVAMADTSVTVVPSGTSAVPQRTVPQAPASIPPLSASAILEAKTHVLSAYSKAPTPATKTTDPIITLGVHSATASSGSVRGKVTYGPNVVYPETASFQSGGWIELAYTGVTKGNLYLLDCGMSKASKLQVTVVETSNIWAPGGLSVSATADTSGHIITGFSAPFSDITIALQYALGSDGKPADNWSWSSCALHPVT
jgi:hypothetical protein